MTKRLTIALVALAMFVLVAVLPVSATPFVVVNTSINAGSSVYIGEQGLDFTNAQNYFSFDNPAKIGWWASAASISSTPASQTYTWSNVASNTISYSAFGSWTGNWYAINGSNVANTTTPFIMVKDPQLSVDIIDWSVAGQPGGVAVSGKSVIQGDLLGFKIGTNMDNAINQPTLRTQGTTGQTNAWAQIRVKTDQGNVFTKLYNASTSAGGVTVNLTSQIVNSAVWYWGLAPQTGNVNNVNWSTSATDATGQYAYPAGTYTIYVDSWMNAMMDNYQLGGAYYTGKTQSASQTVTLASNTVKITANKDTVVRSKAFSVTITGKPGTTYHMWVKGTSTLDGTWDNQPPMIALNQFGVFMDSYATGGATQNLFVYNNSADISSAPNAGGYQYQNGGGTGYNQMVTSQTSGIGGASIWSTVAHGTDFSAGSTGDKLGNGTYLYANVSMNDAGTRTVEWMTTNWTKAQKYTIRVEQNFGSGMSTGSNYKSDEVDVTVAKGSVTIVAAGSQSYYLGEEVKFSGTNTETQTTYLMMTGPNLNPEGSNIASNNPRSAAAAVTVANPSSFTQASVLGDNTWSYKWGTSNIALDAGTYTIWALSGPARANQATELNQVSYGTVAVVIKKPFISATTSQSTVAAGDKVIITGTAQGSPSVGVQIWIMGKNYALVTQQSVNADSTFSYEITRATTTDLFPGQYFVVAQHPMQNNQFDIYPSSNLNTLAASNTPDTTTGVLYVINKQATMQTGTTLLTGQKLFNLLGAGNLQGSDAADALVQGINSPNVDDTYTKLQFLVENPTITINPIGDRHVGDKFTITSTTNLAVDDDVLCQVYSSSFKPTQKTQSGEFSGASGTVKVTKGTSGLNTISFDVDASTFKPDEYIASESGVVVGITSTALFNVLEGAAPTAVPTVVVTTAVPTTVVTTVPPTTVPTPTKTPTQPGFGALVALIGLGAVAFLVVRRH
jgi:PGF-CTERM protein